MFPKTNQGLAAPGSKAMLKLTPGSPERRITWLQLLHLIYILVPYLTIRLPLSILFKHILPLLTFYRYKSAIVKNVGRPAYADVVARMTNYVLSRSTQSQARALLFGRTNPYNMTYSSPLFWGKKQWLSEVKEPGITGRWIANQHTARKDDDLVLFFVHGGGFVLDTGGSAQGFFGFLMQELTVKRGLRFSIFQLDYELAPEYIFPSQIIETQAAYAWLVNKQGISPDKIVLGGDSAGGSIILSFLLHLARSNPAITTPEAIFGPVPRRPAATLCISPFVKAISNLPSRFENADYDLIEHRSAYAAVLSYSGAADITPKLTWWPHHLFFKLPHKDLEIPTSSGGTRNARISAEPKLDTTKARQNFVANMGDPYLNVSCAEDPAWWKEAMPERNLITWGGREIFRDDIVEWTGKLDRADCDYETLVKPLGSHDWLLYDFTIPGLHITNSTGPDRRLMWGVESVADYMCTLTDARTAKVVDLEI
ncbi:uncharacterized protein L969DRAFT_20322 [Mixia osmundae IAM 14324]|uniref:Alpha/beta hydrolase fold-3 domain-containing protein n=1 Tax=Mixia osmundae (strain CBS 9802 / IAM 14324 / JCM 22182 / KY 12970) TaxID=764103 RepID=G7EB37_MIXOS|nr:uncharacterized protein L969DRAFT_20322 [Mixia osmundae IAM 14324]KEI36583.1 hypothetical protein L969DRAFT_20322 [Mixia osmundae IAM 14324]GAB00048.1 hypothetical protein E5Q_06750 [Mixia osmundae IAM 14324]